MRSLISIVIFATIAMSCKPTIASYGYGSDPNNTTTEGDSTDSDSTSDSTDGNNDVVVSISALKSYYKGSTTRITTPLTIEGVVVANDIKGEYSDTIVVDDGSGGIEIYISNSPLYYNYPLGSTVVCRCEDLYIGNDYGVLRLGVASTSADDVVGVIEGSNINKIYLSDRSTTAIPTIVKIAELTANMVTRYVRIESVSFINGGVSLCERDPETGRSISTSHTLRDIWGNEIELFVPYSVEYSDTITPTGCVNINAIVSPPSTSGIYRLRQSDYGIDWEQ